MRSISVRASNHILPLGADMEANIRSIEFTASKPDEVRLFVHNAGIGDTVEFATDDKRLCITIGELKVYLFTESDADLTILKRALSTAIRAMDDEQPEVTA